jgi:hypothetical protein
MWSSLLLTHLLFLSLKLMQLSAISYQIADEKLQRTDNSFQMTDDNRMLTANIVNQKMNLNWRKFNPPY